MEAINKKELLTKLKETMNHVSASIADQQMRTMWEQIVLAPYDQIVKDIQEMDTFVINDEEASFQAVWHDATTPENCPDSDRYVLGIRKTRDGKYIPCVCTYELYNWTGEKRWSTNCAGKHVVRWRELPAYLLYDLEGNAW